MKSLWLNSFHEVPNNLRGAFVRRVSRIPQDRPIDATTLPFWELSRRDFRNGVLAYFQRHRSIDARLLEANVTAMKEFGHEVDQRLCSRAFR